MPAVALSRVVESGPDGENLATGTWPRSSQRSSAEELPGCASRLLATRRNPVGCQKSAFPVSCSDDQYQL